MTRVQQNARRSSYLAQYFPSITRFLCATPFVRKLQQSSYWLRQCDLMPGWLLTAMFSCLSKICAETRIVSGCRRHSVHWNTTAPGSLNSACVLRQQFLSFRYSQTGLGGVAAVATGAIARNYAMTRRGRSVRSNTMNPNKALWEKGDFTPNRCLHAGKAVQN